MDKTNVILDNLQKSRDFSQQRVDDCDRLIWALSHNWGWDFSHGNKLVISPGGISYGIGTSDWTLSEALRAAIDAALAKEEESDE